MAVIFKNPGVIDLRALSTFGLSSKEGEDKIGRFGTGLKYGTAVVMRNGGEMLISTGGETFKVGKKEDEFRGKLITTLTLNGDPLPYTTDLGRDWEPWMAFRELYANALDEGGDVNRAEEPLESCGEETVISVTLPAFEAIFFSMEEHFIQKEEEPIWKSNKMEVYAGRAAFVFYRGVAVMKLKEPSILRYNILSYLDLTEDRTAKYDWQVKQKIAEALVQTDNERIAKNVTDRRNVFESNLDFSSYDASETFLGTSVGMGVNCNPTAMALVKAKLPVDTDQYTVIQKAAPGGKTLLEAIRKLQKCGADLSKVKFVLADGIEFYGDCEVKNKAIFLNQKIFDNQERMDIACVNGYNSIVGNSWLARALLKTVKEEETE